MFAEITEKEIPRLKNIMVSVTYAWTTFQGRNDCEVSDYEVLVYDEYASDWHNITAFYVANAEKIEMLMRDVAEHLVTTGEPQP